MTQKTYSVGNKQCIAQLSPSAEARGCFEFQTQGRWVSFDFKETFLMT